MPPFETQVESMFCAVVRERFSIRPGRGILVVDSQGLGDVVQSLPLLKAVCRWARGRWPVSAIFSSPQHYELVQEERPELTPLFVQHLRQNPIGLLRLWSRLLRRSDLIVCAPEMSAAKLILLKFATRARFAIGEAPAPFSWFLNFSAEASWTRPFLETQDEIAAALGIETPLESPSIRVTSAEIAWAEDELARQGLSENAPLLGVQCASAVPSKCWPSARFGELTQHLAARYPGLAVISFGNALERASAESAHRLAPNIPWFEAAGKFSIRQTLAMLSLCDLFISGDTGLMHMAAAVGTKTLSIFGPTSATRRAPLHNGGVALCPGVACHPCYRGVWTECDCIRRISVEQVELAARECLACASNSCPSFVSETAG